MQTQYLIAGVISREGLLRRILLLAVEGAGEAEHQGGRRLDLEREIGKHLAHQRLLDQRAAEHDPLATVVERNGKSEPRKGGGGHRTIEPRQRHHVDDGGDPRPSAPSRRPWAPSNTTSEEALDRLPSLSLSRRR